VNLTTFAKRIWDQFAKLLIYHKIEKKTLESKYETKGERFKKITLSVFYRFEFIFYKCVAN